MRKKEKKKRKKGFLSRAFEVLLTVVLLCGAGVAVYFMVTDSEGTLALIDQVISLKEEEKGEEGEKKAKNEKKEPSKKSNASEASKKAAETEEKGESISAATPPPVPQETSNASSQILEIALSMYKNMEYKSALGELNRLVPGTLSTRDSERANQLKTWSAAFREIVADTQPLELADAKNIVVLHLANGRKLEGRVLKEKGGFIHLRKNHGITGVIPADEVEKVEEIPRAELLKRREDAYRKLAGDPKAWNPVRIFELVEHCIREGLGNKVTGLLEHGMRMDAHFPVTVYNEKAKRVYVLYLWYKGKKKTKLAVKELERWIDTVPRSHFTAKAREAEMITVERIKRRPTPKPKTPPTPKASPPPARPPRSPLEAPAPQPSPTGMPPDNDLMKAADAVFRKAKHHEEKSFPGKPNADRENRLAIQAFERAIELYEEAQRKFPERAAFIEDRLEEIFASLFWCKKRQTLD
ncbi:MAG: hypothetical protein ACYTHN_16430 [Planctomycetota bacterium]|jgi:uncharacterized protein (UPF0333 family)